MSVVKLLSRIVAPTSVLEALEDPYGMTDDDQQMQDKIASTLHDHTYGITSDPLTQFAVVFSALIHDVDHQGIPNTTLVEENASIASLYHGKSVAEQNSFDLAWELLMDNTFADLRRVICETATEAKRFRQLVINTVLATDIMDKDLKALRNNRWEKAFSSVTTSNTRDNVNRKATIVIEHLIQASDVAHTMQHWHVYRKWNERLFCEMYKAYKQGRAAKNPAEFWYQGEIGFLDFYVIPLAKKLKECGVFGVSSDEYLNYATENRREWEVRGQEVVAGYMHKLSHHGAESYHV
jgi:3'5'-cyclic nucleotide phosphodiesterase